MSDSDWEDFCAMAADKGVADLCLEALDFARVTLGTVFPPAAIARLQDCAAVRSAASAYLQTSSQASRALQDLRAIPKAMHRVRYTVRRVLPSRAFLRSKYPGMAGFPVFILGLRRVVELFTRRSRQVAK